MEFLRHVVATGFSTALDVAPIVGILVVFQVAVLRRRPPNLFLVVEPRARDILERICEAGRFDEEHGAGIAFQIPIEDAVGLVTQIPTIMEELEDSI